MVLGRVPLFYVLHFLLIHLVALALAARRYGQARFLFDLLNFSLLVRFVRLVRFLPSPIIPRFTDEEPAERITETVKDQNDQQPK